MRSGTDGHAAQTSDCTPPLSIVEEFPGTEKYTDFTKRIEFLGDEGLITPEWGEVLTLVVDHKDAVGDSREKIEDIFWHARESTRAIRDLGSLAGEIDIVSQPLEFKDALNREVDAYLALSGIHGFDGREEQFMQFAENLSLYDLVSDELEKSIEKGETTDEGLRLADEYEVFEFLKNGFFKKRVLASVSEEIGVKTLDPRYLQQAVTLNQEIIDNPSISVHKPFKIHATFSKYDIAFRHLHHHPHVLDGFHLPHDAKELRIMFYQDLEDIAGQVLHASHLDADEYFKAHVDNEKRKDRRFSYKYRDKSHRDDFKNNRTESAISTLSEIEVLGRWRERLFEKGIEHMFGVRQAYLHEDHTQYFYRGDALVCVPKTSFDNLVYSRRRDGRMKVEVKKKKDSKGYLIGTFVTPANITGSHDRYLKELRGFAKAKRKSLSGQRLTKKDREVIEEFDKRINVESVIKKHPFHVTILGKMAVLVS